MGNNKERKIGWAETKLQGKIGGKRVSRKRGTTIRFANYVKGVYEIIFAIAANEGFELRQIDIRAAFLQAKQLDRDMFMMPPHDVKG